MTRTALAQGDVVLVPFPFSDLSGNKVRPALIISPGQIGEDVVLMAISSVVRGTLAPTDLVVPDIHPEFAMTGLQRASVLRAHKLFTVERTLITRRIGRIGPQLQLEVSNLLRVVLSL